jgi:hypothetical protein
MRCQKNMIDGAAPSSITVVERHVPIGGRSGA